MRPPWQMGHDRIVEGLRDLWDDRPWGPLLTVGCAGLTFTVLLNAWVCDDAYISFRVVDNLIHGHGLVWNVGERVQAFTNPLFTLVLAAFSLLTRDVYFTSLAISIAASVGAVVVLVTRVSRSRVSSALAVVILVFSASFVSYATSGLENCLIFLLSALFFAKYFQSERHGSRALLILTVLFSLSVVNRMDVALLLAPALAFAFWKNDSVGFGRLARSAALGLTPLLAWEAFSLVYYGFLFPNTAYAKLNTGIPGSEYLVRGIWYYSLSLLQDPMVLLALVVGAALILLVPHLKTSVPLIGVLLYLMYIARIGGDFMRGRYFAAPLFVVLLVFVSISPQEWRLHGITPASMAAAVAALVLVQNIAALVYSSMDLNHFTPYGIYNDKAIYFPSSNLVMNLAARQLEKSRLVRTGHELSARGHSPVVRATLGFTGYYAGPKVHIVDPLALSDALLARMPAVNEPGWHIGHAVRYIPDGYLETVRTGRNEIADPDLAKYYDNLSLVIKGDLWSRERWDAIYQLNTGKLDHLIDRKHYRSGVANRLDIDGL